MSAVISLERLANPGSILLTRATLNLVEGFVTVKSLGPVAVKGLTDPVEVYEVTGAPRADASSEEDIR